MQGLAPSRLSRKRLSLTIRISALLITAVILPLLITIVSSELILRPTLTAQAVAEMENDAQRHQTAIDTLFIARLQDLDALGQFYAIQQFLAGNRAYLTQASSELQLGTSLDQNYGSWTLFDASGKILLSYPTNPARRGNYDIAPEIMLQLRSPNKTYVSDVYFDQNVNMAFVDIYASIALASSRGDVAGIVRSTLSLNEIWTAVNNETNAATGSYAMIIDGHGVRIAYTNTDTTLTTLPKPLFQAIAPIPKQFQQQIKDENLYGNSHAAVEPLVDTMLASQQQNQRATSYEFTPAEQTQAFEAYQVHCQVIPWTYIVLRPISTITGAASQQDMSLLIVAVVITLMAAVVGLLIGRNTTHPILNSVSSLAKSSEMLKVFARSEQARAKEQKWIIESAQIGLNSVQYYAKANVMGAAKLDEIAQAFAHNWEKLDYAQIQQYLREIISAADYIKKVAAHEDRSSRGLLTAIQVTNQVAEQLISGAASASEAAVQLEEVIAQLRRVVGE